MSQPATSHVIDVETQYRIAEHHVAVKRFEALTGIKDRFTVERNGRSGSTVLFLADILHDMRHFCGEYGINFREVSVSAARAFIENGGHPDPSDVTL